jgi:hypothetical protein
MGNPLTHPISSEGYTGGLQICISFFSLALVHLALVDESLWMSKYPQHPEFKAAGFRAS